ncbi:hypothetical protein JCM8547_003358 [Rhodosporidiobolus lusitaniae]
MAPRDLSRSLQRTVTHLKPATQRGGKFARNAIPTHFRQNPAFVQVKDRIPFWHIAPGDRVMMVKGSEDVKGKVGVVDRVERETNRVYLKEPEFAVKKRQFAEYPGQQLEPDFSSGEGGGTYTQPRAFHVSNLRLQVCDGEDEYTATRVRKSKVTWDRRLRRFAWKRYALVPALGGKTEGDAGWRELPWPKEDVPTTQKGPLDSDSPVSLRSSWVPSLSSLSLSPSSLSTPSRSPVAPLPKLPAGAPPELQVGQLDLGGAFWSRAKRTERYNEKRERSKEYGKGVMKAKGQQAKAVKQFEQEVLL